MNKIICSDALTALKTLADDSVDMCVTSPPYYGLRDYGDDNQIGMEKSPQEYIENLTEIFMEVYRVLKPEGTLWINIGDSYAGSGKGPMSIAMAGNGKNKTLYEKNKKVQELPKKWQGIKPKDMIGIPWMLAFSLREKGWYLRSDIIWRKTNCLPESVKDRPTKCYEHIFLLAKRRKYFYDYQAIQEPLKDVTKERYKRGRSEKSKYAKEKIQPNINCTYKDFSTFDQTFRRKRDVWEMSTNTYRIDEHFAMYPEKLIEPCVKAGSERGGIVLDPFFGCGTTGVVAKRLGRQYIGIELNPKYCELSRKRIALTNEKE